MRYYISDLHFYHRNIETLDYRGFSTMLQMHDYMVKQWNSVVKNDDQVIVLGDFSFGNGIQSWEIMNRLNGRISLIEGNHDFHFLDDKDFIDNFEDVYSYSETIDNGKNLILSHFPILFYNYQFRKDETNQYQTYMMYGHVHNTYEEYMINRTINDLSQLKRESLGENIGTTPFQMINTFCGFSDYRPLTIDQWIRLDKKRRELINSLEKENNGFIDHIKWKEINKLMLEKGKSLFEE